jgi:hypothetical protein
MAGHVLLRLGIALFAIAVPIGTVFSRRLLFVLVPVSAALIIVGGVLLPNGGDVVLRHLRKAMTRPILLLGTLLLIWAALSFIWTPFPELASERFLKSVGTILAATIAIACMPERLKAANGNLLPIGIGLAGIAALGAGLINPAAFRSVEGDSSLFQRAISGLLVMGWPALAVLVTRERANYAIALAAILVFATLLAAIPVTVLTLLISVAVFAAARQAPATTGTAVGLTGALLMIAAPALVLAFQPVLSSVDLLGIGTTFNHWAEIIRSEGAKLVTGHGFDTSLRAVAAGILPQQAPRGILFEVWYELGAVGAVGSAVLIRLTSLAALRLGNLAPYLLASLSAVLVLSIAGTSIAQLWWTTQLASGALAVALVMRVQPARGRVRASVLRQRPTL